MISRLLIQTAVAFFVIGVLLGMYMGIRQDFRFIHVHAHINLLGWVALGLAGLIYSNYPHLQQGWLAPVHYWLHTVGLVIFMGGFAWGSATGSKPFLPIAIGSSMVTVGVLLFAINIFTRLQPALQAREP
jgi:cbb3-type cytochrome oxidase subunit 1